MKLLKNKILRAINKGLNEALNLDDFSEDDLKIQKKSLSTIIKNSNLDNTILYYQNLMNEIMSKDMYDITEEDINRCIGIYLKYNILYNPHSDREYFRYFIHNIIKKCIYKNINLNWIDTSDVTDMYELFKCSTFNGDISKWDVSNVKNMSYMFQDSEFNGDLSKWNVSSVTNMRAMFEDSKFNGDISKWDVSSVINMWGLFAFSAFNQDISDWDVSNVKDMCGMFCKSNFNQDISNWDVSKVIDMREIFLNLNPNMFDISKWNINPNCDTQYMYTRD